MVTDFTAVIYDGPGTEPYFDQVSLRAPKNGELVLKMTAAGICHSDLHAVNGDWPFDHRISLGHEGTGIVHEVGPDVTDFAPGDHVLLSWFATCGQCKACLTGETWLCNRSTTVGNFGPDGATPIERGTGDEIRPYLGVGTFAEYTLVSRRSVVKIPDEFPADVAALIGCSILTGIGAVLNTAEVKIGDTALVVGCGGVGQAIIMGLELVRASVIIAIDINEAQLETARSLGATHVLNGNDPDLTAKVIELTGGGVDFAFDAIGRTATVATLPAMVRQGGATVLVGLPKRDDTAAIPTWIVAALNQRILGCNYGSSNIQIDFPKIAGLFMSGQLPLDRLVERHVPQSQAITALLDLPRSTGGRTVVDFAL